MEIGERRNIQAINRLHTVKGLTKLIISLPGRKIKNGTTQNELFILTVRIITWWLLSTLSKGFSGGAFTLASPVYISEIGSPHLRGSLSALMPLMATAGVSVVNGLNIKDAVSWQIITFICMVTPGKYSVLCSARYILTDKKLSLKKAHLTGTLHCMFKCCNTFWPFILFWTLHDSFTNYLAWIQLALVRSQPMTIQSLNISLHLLSLH